MARKWREFFNFLQSFVLRLWSWLAGRGRRRVAWVLGLGALVVVLASAPGLAQLAGQTKQGTAGADADGIEAQVMELYDSGQYSEAVRLLEAQVDSSESGSLRRAILQVNLGRLYSELGRQVQACRNLTDAFGMQVNICEGEDLPELPGDGNLSLEELPKVKVLRSLTGPFLSQEIQRDPQKARALAKSLRIFGDVLRGVGELENSLLFLEASLKFTNDLNASELKPSLFLSLGNTYRALGNLERDRGSVSQYEYIPWKFSRRQNFEDDDIKKTFEKANYFYERAGINYQYAIQFIDRSEISSEEELEKDIKAKILVNSTLINQISTLINQIELIDYSDSEEEKALTEKAIALSREIDSNDLKQDLISHELQFFIYDQISLAKNLNYLAQMENEISKASSDELSTDKILNLLKYAISCSEKLSGEAANKFQSYSKGNLGGFYEFLSSKTQLVDNEALFKEARDNTLDALYIIQNEESPEVAYQWHWQMGRLTDKQNENLESNQISQEALKYYQ